MNKKLVIGISAVVLLMGGFWLLNNNQPMTEPEPTDEIENVENDSEMIEEETTENQADEAMTDDSTVKEFAVGGGGFYFDPAELTVTEGDTVRIVFTNEGGVHDWVIDEFDARTPIIQAGETSTIEFVADQVGTFEYYCSVGEHRAMGMVGNLIVLPK